jgi:hypothetical protein
MSVVVEGVEIPERLIAREAQHHPGLSAAEARLAAGRALATKALLLDRARTLGLAAGPEFDEEGREETKDEALIRAVLTAEVEVETPTEEECRRVYAQRLAGRAGAPAFEAVRGKIAESLEQRAWTSAAARFVAALGAEAKGRGVALSLADDGDVVPGSATLGGLLAGGAEDRLAPWLAATDPAVAEKVAEAAAAEGRDIGDFVRAAFAAFVQSADDAAWTHVISAAQGADDPALACLAAALKARLEPKPVLRTVMRRR